MIRVMCCRLTVFVFMTVALSRFAVPASSRTEMVLIRGKAQPVVVCDPPSGLPKRGFQVVVTSGDMGWVGLPVNIAEHACAEGYRVIGFNARAYLSSFTGRETSLKPEELPGDLQTLLDWAASAQGAPSSFVLIGVSEGAGLNVVAAGQMQSSRRVIGMITLGLPYRTSLGWRWTDFPMWVTKKDPREPLTDTGLYLSRLQVPLVMIHSTHDEWDSIDLARIMFTLAPGPKNFIAIAASNHRFSDKLPEVLSQIDSSLRWLANPAASKAPGIDD